MRIGLGPYHPHAAAVVSAPLSVRQRRADALQPLQPLRCSRCSVAPTRSGRVREWRIVAVIACATTVDVDDSRTKTFAFSDK